MKVPAGYHLDQGIDGLTKESAMELDMADTCTLYAYKNDY